jgi:hypothetical protein
MRYAAGSGPRRRAHEKSAKKQVLAYYSKMRAQFSTILRHGSPISIRGMRAYLKVLVDNIRESRKSRRTFRVRAAPYSKAFFTKFDSGRVASRRERRYHAGNRPLIVIAAYLYHRSNSQILKQNSQERVDLDG